jgi:phosphotransferase system  glucose/maltose/N-acetylglucosamine-specific IIC component
MALTGRNDRCPCGSGKKYKKCCEQKQAKRSNNMLLIIVGALTAAGLVAGIAAFTSDRGSTQPAAGKVWSPEHGHYH